MASISSNPETTAVCQDWVVELRGFEPMASLLSSAIAALSQPPDGRASFQSSALFGCPLRPGKARSRGHHFDLRPGAKDSHSLGQEGVAMDLRRRSKNRVVEAMARILSLLHQLDVALGLPFEPPARLNAIEIAVEIDLQQRRGMISRRPVCSGARRYRGIASRMKLGERVVSTRDIASPRQLEQGRELSFRPARSTMDDKHVHICEPIWMRRIVIGEHRVNDDNPALGPHCRSAIF